MSVIEYTGPQFGSPDWYKYWNRRRKDDIIYALKAQIEYVVVLEEQNKKMRGELIAINNLCGQKDGEFADQVFALCKDY